MKKNQRGSVLLWALILMMVIIITLGACLTISFSYFSRSLTAQVEKQAYYTAHSAMSAVIKELGNNDENTLKRLVPAQVNECIEIPEITFSNKGENVETFGSSSAKIMRIAQDQLKITATGTIGGETYQVYGDVFFLIDQDSTLYRWQLIQLYDDETHFEINE